MKILNTFCYMFAEIPLPSSFKFHWMCSQEEQEEAEEQQHEVNINKALNSLFLQIQANKGFVWLQQACKPPRSPCYVCRVKLQLSNMLADRGCARAQLFRRCSLHLKSRAQAWRSLLPLTPVSIKKKDFVWLHVRNHYKHASVLLRRQTFPQRDFYLVYSPQWGFKIP